MPSSMIHLMIAKKYDPDAPVQFFIGSLAPDVYKERETKDKVHFRDVDDREWALRRLAEGTDPSNRFLEGELLHLYADWLWDETLLTEYMEYHAKEEDWYLSFRKELGFLSAKCYRETPGAPELFRQMLLCDGCDYGAKDDATRREIFEMMRRVYSYHERTEDPCPSFFTFDIIEKFTDKVALKYADWRAGNRYLRATS